MRTLDNICLGSCALLLFLRAFTPAHAQEPWHPAKGLLATQWSSQVTPTNVWPEYPRPQLVRERWLNLNGLWYYQIAKREEAGIPSQYAGQILVPFPLEAPLSGVMQPLQPNQRLWYQREFALPADWAGQRVLLHFGAVDWEATVFIDGQKLGTHRGGYDSFSFDITKILKTGGTHKIAVSVWDPCRSRLAEGVLYGKQTPHPGGCSYTAASGIWQTAWLEPVPASYIEQLKAVPDLDKGVLKLTVTARTAPHPHKVQAIVSEHGKSVATLSGGIGDEITPDNEKNIVDFFKSTSAQITAELEIPIPSPKTWSPDSPFLYDLRVTLKDAAGKEWDAVTSYFGMRSVKIGHDTDGNTRLLLNGQPIMLPGVWIKDTGRTASIWHRPTRRCGLISNGQKSWD